MIQERRTNPFRRMPNKLQKPNTAFGNVDFVFKPDVQITEPPIIALNDFGKGQLPLVRSAPDDVTAIPKFVRSGSNKWRQQMCACLMVASEDYRLCRRIEHSSCSH